MRKLLGSNVLTLAALSLACLALPGLAGEFPAGEPIERHGMKIAGVYLQPVEMEPAIAGQEAGHADIHLEADIHATAANPNGLGEGDWIPYLRIAY
ncbi:MAG: iron transporter, partial [Alphaproteobacteria bacterium]|nr:iron transporter [Alphaproteobacteria bacterium]